MRQPPALAPGSPLHPPRPPEAMDPDDPWSLCGPSPGGRGPEDSWLSSSAPGPTPASHDLLSMWQRRYSTQEPHLPGLPSSVPPRQPRGGRAWALTPPPCLWSGTLALADFIEAPSAEKHPAEKTRRTSRRAGRGPASVSRACRAMGSCLPGAEEAGGSSWGSSEGRLAWTTWCLWRGPRPGSGDTAPSSGEGCA